MKEQEFKQDMRHIISLEKSWGKSVDINGVEKLADEIQTNWGQKDKKYYAKLMLEVCKPLSSGRFKSDRQYSLARKYALLALQEPNEIPLETELHLIGHVITNMLPPHAPEGQTWSQQRKRDAEVRFHAWKRLNEAVDPNWDPNEILFVGNVTPPGATGLPAGIVPEAIKDPELRAEYEAAIEENRQKAERYSQQSRLHDWQRHFPQRAEEYIVQAYSKPPFDLEELKQYLQTYVVDKKTRERILNAVTKNMKKKTN